MVVTWQRQRWLRWRLLLPRPLCPPLPEDGNGVARPTSQTTAAGMTTRNKPPTKSINRCWRTPLGVTTLTHATTTTNVSRMTTVRLFFLLLSLPNNSTSPSWTWPRKNATRRAINSSLACAHTVTPVLTTKATSCASPAASAAPGWWRVTRATSTTGNWHTSVWSTTSQMAAVTEDRRPWRPKVKSLCE